MPADAAARDTLRVFVSASRKRSWRLAVHSSPRIFRVWPIDQLGSQLGGCRTAISYVCFGWKADIDLIIARLKFRAMLAAVLLALAPTQAACSVRAGEVLELSGKVEASGLTGKLTRRV